ncbi:MAG: flagellar motor protein MotB [Thermonemataceae bacterium]
MKKIFIFIFSLVYMASCVSKKEYQAVKSKNYAQENQLKENRATINQLGTEVSTLRSQNELYKEQIEDLRNTNKSLLDRVSDLSDVSKAGMETLKSQNTFIQSLTQKIQQKDSVAMVLVNNIKKSLDDVNDKDINVKVIKGVVFISLSDNLLFRSGQTELLPDARRILAKVSKIIKDNPDLEVLVEGHTDNQPISTNCIEDNWDLSVLRATEVVRYFQKEFSVVPARMTAGGRSEYVPKAKNDSAQGRSVNRRTEIILTPKLDEFYELLQDKEAQEKE